MIETTLTKRRRPYEDRGRDWNHTLTRQGMPRARQPADAREAPEYGSADTLILDFWSPGP